MEIYVIIVGVLCPWPCFAYGGVWLHTRFAYEGVWLRPRFACGGVWLRCRECCSVNVDNTVIGVRCSEGCFGDGVGCHGRNVVWNGRLVMKIL